MTDPKALRMRLYKIDGFIRIYDGTNYLALFDSEKYDAIDNRMRYIISLKSGITYIFSQFYKSQSLFLWLFAYRNNIDFV